MSVHGRENSPWKETAWNGIRFQAPARWEPGSIGNRYLLIENDVGPVLELKWGAVKGAFSHRKHLRRLAKSFRNRSGIRIQEMPLPADWSKALKRFETSGFLWTGDRLGGRGVILYCPVCRQATLVQFYDDPARSSDPVHLKILRSLEDHPAAHETRWAVFDIRAIIPDRYRLKYHRFEPGRFELAFESGRRQLTLYRWGPAGAALADRTLAQFAKMMIPMLQGEDQYHLRDAGDRIDFEFSGKVPMLQRFKRRKTVLKVRIWHEAKKNKILGIRLEANASTADMMLDTLAKRYETL